MKAKLNASRFVWIVVMGTTILFLNACAPHITKFTPGGGVVGTQVIIEGERFGATPADNTVKFGNVVATISSMPAAGKIITSVPAGAVTALLSVQTSKGTGYSDKNFIVPDSAKWTFMVYVDGDNNLEGAAIDDFLEMAQVGSTPEMNILVQLDRTPGYNSAYNDWTDTRRFRIVKGSVPSDAPIQNLGESNMGDPNVLRDFVEWGITTYPANHYALVIWNHGGGWRDARETMAAKSAEEVSRGESVSPVARAIAWDDTDDDVLFMKEVQNALTAARDRYNTMVKLDLVGFDACLMGMVEVAYAIRDNASVMVGSEQVEPWDGWPYKEILSDLRTNISLYEPEDLGGVIVTKYYDSYSGSSEITQAAVKIKDMNDLVSKIDYFTTVATTDWTVLKTARNNSIVYHPGFYSYWGVDIWDFANEVYNNTTNTAIRSAALEMRNAVSPMIINELHSSDMDGSHGVAIYFPATLNAFNNDPDHTGYLNENTDMPVDFVTSHKWDDWLQEYYAH
jgi:hypothetical protein